MSILDLVARAVGYERTPVPREAKGKVDAPYTWSAWQDGQPDWTTPSMQTFANGGYKGNAIIYACISEKAGSASLAPLVAYQGERDAPERVPDTHPLALLLMRPNPFMSWFEFQELLNTYLDLDGNAFIYKACSSLDGPVEALYPLRSDRVRPVPKGGKLLGYVYDPQDMGGWTSTGEVFLPDEIIHVKYPNPLDPFEGLGRGQSPLTAAAREGDLDNYYTSFLGTFFNNAVVPFGLLTSKLKLADTEVARIRGRLREQYAGADRWNDIMILDADATYQRLGLSIEELDFSVLDMRNEARIAAVLKVPPIIVGLRVGLEHNTYSNNQEARRSFWEDKLIPHLYARFEGQWNLGLASEFPGVWLAYDYSHVPALRENESIKRQDAVSLYTHGIARRNEARRIAGLDPVEDKEDCFYGDPARAGATTSNEAKSESPAPDRPILGYHIEQGVVTRNEARQALALPADGDDAKDAARRNLLAALTVVQAAVNARIPLPQALKLAGLDPSLSGEQGASPPVQEGAAALSSGVAQEKALKVAGDERADLDDIEEEMTDEVAHVLAAQLAILLPDGASLEQVQAAAAQIQESEELRQALVRGLREAVQRGVSEAAPLGGVGIDWTLANEAAQRWAEEYSYELVRAITETNRTLLREAVSEWVESGKPLSALTDRLTDVFGPRRARLIAITETTRAYTEGNVRAWAESGLATQRPIQTPPAHPGCRCWLVVEGGAYIWRTAVDDRVCLTCGPRHNTAMGQAR